MGLLRILKLIRMYTKLIYLVTKNVQKRDLILLSKTDFHTNCLKTAEYKQVTDISSSISKFISNRVNFNSTKKM